MVEAGARDNEIVGDGFGLAPVLVERKEPLPPCQHQPMVVLPHAQVRFSVHDKIIMALVQRGVGVFKLYSSVFVSTWLQSYTMKRRLCVGRFYFASLSAKTKTPRNSL